MSIMSFRVCYILPRLLPGKSGIIVGGHASNCISLAMELKRQGVEIEILASIPKESMEFLSNHPVGEIIIPLPMLGRGMITKGLGAIWMLRRTLKKRMQEKKYDVVHCHSGAYPYATMPLTTNRETFVRLHSLYCPIGAKGGVYSRWWEKPSAVRFLFNRLDKVVAVTSNVRQSIEKAGISSEKIEFIPMSVDTRRFHPVGDYNESAFFPEASKGARMLFVGNASKEKGLVELLEAVWILIQKGLSPYLIATLENQNEIKDYASGYDYVEKRIRELGLRQNVRIVGLINDIENLYAESDFIVSPWRTTRGPSDYPMVVLETMAMGKCIVSTPVGGCSELLQYGNAGILTEDFSPIAMANAMEYAIEHPEIRRQVGQLALSIISERFSVEGAGKRMIELYERLLVRKQGFS